VGFLTQWYAPEPITLPGEFASGLIALGWQARVLTGVPNYPTGSVQPGYSVWRPARDRVGGVPLLRTPLYPSHDRSTLRRVLNYATWAISASLSAPFWLARSDVCLVYGSPITAAIPALALKRLRGIPYVVQVHDLWPDSIVGSGFTRPMPPIVERILNWVCRRLYSEAAACVVISPGMAEILVDRGVAAERIHRIYNWADETLRSPTPRSGILRARFGIDESTRVLVYAGNLGVAQGLGRWIEAVHEVPECHLVLIGDGLEKPALVDLAERLGASNVHFHASVKPQGIPELVADADAQLVSLIDRPLFRSAMPSKLQSAFAAGSPVLASVAGDAAQAVRDAGAGIAVAPDDVAAMRAALGRFRSATPQELRQWGLGARAHYDAHMSRAVGLTALSGVLGEAINQRKGAHDFAC